MEKVRWDIAPGALERWTPGLMAAAAADNSISIFEVIGEDSWTGEGITAKKITESLRAIGAEKDVIVNINSPGGDYVEGLAIYNILRAHKGNVLVRVLGMAASAASMVAMAGDEIQIARAGFIMIHNTWVVAIGDRLDLREMADRLEPFDAMMANIYALRSGMDDAAVQKMMDAETYITGAEAVETGFADALLPADEIKTAARAESAPQIAARKLDLILARQGMPRSERKKLMHELKTGKPGAAEGMPSAAAARGDISPAIRNEFLAALLRMEVGPAS